MSRIRHLISFTGSNSPPGLKTTRCPWQPLQFHFDDRDLLPAVQPIVSMVTAMWSVSNRTGTSGTTLEREVALSVAIYTKFNCG